MCADSTGRMPRCVHPRQRDVYRAAPGTWHRLEETADMATTVTQGPIVGLVYELRTRGEGTYWTGTLDGAYACAARRKDPRSITPLYFRLGARIVAGPTIMLTGVQR